MTPRVVGLDLSITATGIAAADGTTLTVGGPASDGDQRLVKIADTIYRRFVIWQPWRTDLVVIEDLAVHGPGNGMAAAQVMGAVKLVLCDTRYALAPPSTVKKYATGRGNATKADMAVALYKRCGLELPNDNEVDAYWLRLMGLDWLGHPAVDLPATHRQALNGVTWPTPKENPT